MLVSVGGVVSPGVATVRVVSSAMAAVVTSGTPPASLRTAPALTLSWSVPALVGVIGTVKIPEVGAVSVTVPMLTPAVPALPKSAASIVVASMSPLKVTV